MVCERRALAAALNLPQSLTQETPDGTGHYLAFQSENSAFDRVSGKVASSVRQPHPWLHQPAEPVHTITLVTSDTPESISERHGWAQPPRLSQSLPQRF